MVFLQACWSPCFCYNNVKHGTMAVAVYTIAVNIVAICYFSWIMEGGQSSELYSPMFESNTFDRSTYVLGGCFNAYCLLFMIFSVLLLHGTRNDIRGYFWPYIVWMVILILYTASLGIWFIARYYTYPISVLSAIFTWIFCSVHIYCLLCVLSQYQVLKHYQSANIVVLYP